MFSGTDKVEKLVFFGEFATRFGKGGALALNLTKAETIPQLHALLSYLLGKKRVQVLAIGARLKPTNQ